MKTLVIIICHALHETYLDKMKNSFEDADFALVTSEEYTGMFDFKYKLVTPVHQLAKLCNFLNTLEEKYEWYVKIRPEVELNSCVSFENLPTDAINARCRVYYGPRKIPYGTSLGGNWTASYTESIRYDPNNEHIILDDQMYIFHRNVFEQGMCLLPFEEGRCHEWCHTKHWLKKGIKLNPIGINLNFHHHAVGLCPSNHINCD